MTIKKQYKLPQHKHYLKVTDDATGEIAACGVWVYLPEGYCIEDEYVAFESVSALSEQVLSLGILDRSRYSGEVFQDSVYSSNRQC